MENKPNMDMSNQDGNIFNILGLASKILRQNNLGELKSEMQQRVLSCKSYDEALSIISEYVNFV